MIKFTSLALTVAAAMFAMSSAEASIGRDVVRAHSSDYYSYYADPGEVFDVEISGDGTSDLDLIVRGPGGNIVCQRMGPTDDESCRLRSNSGGAYRVEVRNVGNVWNQYFIRLS